jgi:hypothetical protein
MRKESDRNGRKRYWVKLANQIKRSRVVLNRADIEWLLPTLSRQRERIPSYGQLIESGTSSAFILDFGSVTIVEFNEVGFAYIYPRRVAHGLFEDLYKPRWSKAELRHPQLVQSRSAERIRHISGWQDMMTSELEKYGLSGM